MPDFPAISTALALRFAAVNVTPPAGQTNIRESTGNPPNQLSALPMVVTFPDTGEFTAGSGQRTGLQDYLVRFYYSEGTDLTRDNSALQAWLAVLVDQLRLSSMLGGLTWAGSVPGQVQWALVSGWKIGVLPYAGMDYIGIELAVQVRTGEAWSAVA